MNKTQFYTLSGALLASTALSGAASAGTIGRFDSNNSFVTTPLNISNTVFSTTATSADTVVIGGAGVDTGIGMRYTNAFSGTTRWTTEFTISGARFVTGALTTGNVRLMLATLSNTNSVMSTISGTNGTGTSGCASVSTLVNLFVVNDCALTAGHSRAAIGIAFTGVTFNTASALATAGSSVSLTGRVYNPQNTSQTFEESSTGTILASVAPYQVVVTPASDQVASATTTPTAFTSLSNAAGNLTMTLATVRISGVGALGNGLGTTVATTSAATTSVTVSSSILSGGAVRTVTLNAAVGAPAALSYLTAANFSGGSATFTVNNTLWTGTSSFNVSVEFRGTTAIPAAVAGTISGSITSDTQTIAYSGATAAVTQGGFRSEINTFNASTNGPFGSYLRVHNNGIAAGAVTITVRNDATGEVLGQPWTTESIATNATKQFTALEIENGAEIPSESRTGSYTLSVTGPIIGYTQHILFDGNSVADLSGFRNAGSTSNNP